MLRPYQLECVEKVMEWPVDSQLVVMATGLGKTFTSAAIMNNYGSAFFVAHRRELIAQAAKSIISYTGREVGIEMGSKRSKGEPFIVGSIQSIVKRELPTPEIIVVDEAHHAVSSTYREFLDKHPSAKLLGVTATPDRADGKPLGALFKRVAYRYETPKAIADGWLAPIFTRKVSGVSGLVGAVGDRKTIVFTPNVASAIEVAGLLPRASYVHGELSATVRDERIAKFKNGELQFMTNCNVLTEGFDAPDIGCVCMMRATESRGLFMQALGRGLRIAPGKDDCLFLDMVDMPKHSMEGPRDALGGREGKPTAPDFLPKNSFWRKFFA